MNLPKLSLIKTIGNYIKYPLIIGATVLITKYLSPTTVDTPIVYDAPKEYEDINNKIHSVIEERKINIHSHKEYADSVAKLLKIKTKELETVTSALSKMEVQYIDKPTTVYTTKDTAYSMTKEDEWVRIHAYLSKDSGSLIFSAHDSLTIVQVNKKSLFSSTRYIDISHSNPYIRTTKAYSLSFKQDYPRLTIGPYIGYGYNFGANRFSPSLGISVQIPLIKIK